MRDDKEEDGEGERERAAKMIDDDKETTKKHVMKQTKEQTFMS